MSGRLGALILLRVALHDDLARPARDAVDQSAYSVASRSGSQVRSPFAWPGAGDVGIERIAQKEDAPSR